MFGVGLRMIFPLPYLAFALAHRLFDLFPQARQRIDLVRVGLRGAEGEQGSTEARRPQPRRAVGTAGHTSTRRDLDIWIDLIPPTGSGRVYTRAG